MKTIKYLFLIILFSTILHNGYSQSYDKIIYDAYINNNTTEWEEVLKEMEKNSLNTVEEKLQLINYYYGYIGYLIGNKKKDQAKTYIKKGQVLIDEVLQDSPENVTAYAYKGSFLSFDMAVSKIKAFVAAPKSMRYINKAYELDPHNIQAVTDKGNLMSYAPAIAGGDKKEAVKYYEQAISILENKNDTDENWFYLNLLVTLAETYKDINESEKAEKTYKKAIKKEPKLTWIKDIYPHFSIEDEI